MEATEWIKILNSLSVFAAWENEGRDLKKYKSSEFLRGKIKISVQCHPSDFRRGPSSQKR